MVKYSKLYGHKNKTFVAISSGANMDFDRLRFVSERADSSESLMAVSIPERPGSFRELYTFLYPRNVTGFIYRHNGTSKANVFVSFQALSGKSLDEDKLYITENLKQNGYGVTDLSNNEMAKSHVQHLAGGRATSDILKTNDPAIQYQELLYRFEFPEAPGALNKFLSTVNHFNQGWSISLFHYRNHGHDFGRVLVGLLVKQSESKEFQLFLENLGYAYYQENGNAAAKLLLEILP
jgi:threonine dehydratase